MSGAPSIMPSATPHAREGRKFLTFALESEAYGLDIQVVHEIIAALPITRVPRTPPFVRGVINLRGRVIPIVDLRLKLGIAPTDSAEGSCIIVVDAGGLHMGLVVDRVSDVATLAADQIEEPPALGPDVHTDYLLGIAKSGGRITLLLDIERVLSTRDVIVLRATESAPPDTLHRTPAP